MNNVSRVEEYKGKLSKLQMEKTELERKLIILEEQYNQYKEKVEQSFHTTDPDELRKIADAYLMDIQQLEGLLNG